MNITFLIGNGFDLNLGLKTDYNSFINEYKKDFDKSKKPEYDNSVNYLKGQISKDQKTWASAEVAFGQVTNVFSKDQKTAELFSDCHEDFCVCLAEYLKKQQERISWDKDLKLIGNEFIKSINTFKASFSPAELDNINKHENRYAGAYIFNFVNFNYTDTIKKCIDAVKSTGIEIGNRVFANTNYKSQIGKFYHVNGTVNEYMVFGVNDETQISNRQLFDGYSPEYIGQLIKSETDRLNGQNTYNHVKDLITKSDFIYIYGMSIGITDSIWWEMICEWLSFDKSHQLFIHKHSAPEKGLIQRKYATYEKRMRQEFLEYSSLKKEDLINYIENIHIDRNNIFEGLHDLAYRIPSTPIPLSDFLETDYSQSAIDNGKKIVNEYMEKHAAKY